MKSVLVAAAHVDDPIIGAGGVIGLLSDLGYRTHVLSVCGDRSEGYEEAIANLGGTPLKFDYSYGSVEKSDRLVGMLQELFKSISPDIVFTHWSDEILIDHQIVSETVIEIARRQDVSELYLFEIPASSVNFHFDVSVDITQFYSKKVNAIKMLRGIDSTVFEREIWPSIAYTSGFRGIQVGCQYAEVFKFYGSRKPLSPYHKTLISWSDEV